MNFDTIIIRFGEMNTKGKNKKDFINKLSHQVEDALSDFRNDNLYSMRVRHDHIYIDLKEKNVDLHSNLLKIQGIHSISLALKVNKNIDEICNVALEELKNSKAKTFKIYSRRIDKTFELISDEINRKVASKILKNTELKVDVHHPDVLLSIEIRDDYAYMFTDTLKALGGYPKGTLGRCLMMLSGGIDSPVATYLLIKRGVEVQCIHYASPPYTNSGVISKLEDILSELNTYQSKIKLYIVPFTKIQEKIYEISPVGYPITIMRRMMYRLAAMLANKLHIPVIANGESIGQVASQTLASMNVINEVTNIPVVRPLAIFDKLEIINIAKEIGTYEISIRPFEDCCTIFAPVKPKTAPKLEECLKIEEKFDFEPLLKEAIDNVELKVIKK